jgi:hypothetical protein
VNANRKPSEAAVAAIRRALLDEAQDTRDSSGPAREPVPGTNGLLYRGVATSFFAPRGEGKSLAVIVTTLSAAAAGERVAYFDRENGAALTREWVEAILEAHPDWGDPLAEGRWAGRHYPTLDKGWEPEAFGEALEGFTIVVFDSLREMLAQLEADPDREKDISRFFNLAVTPLVRRGATPVTLDNTGHNEDQRPKGSGTKLDAPPQVYRVATVEQFTPVLSGRVKIECTRSRLGDEGREWTMGLGGGVFEAPTTLSEAPDARKARKAREGREAFRKAAVAALREKSPLGRDALVKAARKGGAKGRSDALRGTLAELAADPASGLIATEEGFALTPDPGEMGQGRVTPPEAPLTRSGVTPLRGVPGGVNPDPEDAGQAATADEEADVERIAAKWGLEL